MRRALAAPRRRRTPTRTTRASASAWPDVRRAPLIPASSHKAGLAPDDDARIADTIHRVSRGSKFYENQRARHAAVTRRIARVCARRDEALASLSAHARTQLTARADRLAAQLEGGRDLSRTLLHCDMDMFYAAVELQRDPSLRGTCFAVGHGVLLTASYEARTLGVRSGMAEFVARALCPHLHVVPAHMDRYRAASEAVMRVLRRYDPDLVPRSLDEAYLDVTPVLERDGIDAEALVAQLRADVECATGLTVSVGIAPNTLLAKIASDRHKPNGQCRVPPDRDAILAFLHDLPVRKVPGIGHVTERILDALDVPTCGALWARRGELSVCMDHFSFLLAAALGIGASRLHRPARTERKSVGRENTFAPTAQPDALDAQLRQTCTQLAADLARLDFRARTVALVGKHDTFARFTRQHSVAPRSVATFDELYALGRSLLAQEHAAAAAQHRPLTLRLLGVRASALVDVGAHDASPLERWLQAAPVHTCPVCAQAIHVEPGASEVQRSEQINRHMDRCLGVDEQAERPTVPCASPPPGVRKRPAPEARPASPAASEARTAPPDPPRKRPAPAPRRKAPADTPRLDSYLARYAS